MGEVPLLGSGTASVGVSLPPPPAEVATDMLVPTLAADMSARLSPRLSTVPRGAPRPGGVVEGTRPRTRPRPSPSAALVRDGPVGQPSLEAAHPAREEGPGLGAGRVGATVGLRAGLLSPPRRLDMPRVQSGTSRREEALPCPLGCREAPRDIRHGEPREEEGSGQEWVWPRRRGVSGLAGQRGIAGVGLGGPRMRGAARATLDVARTGPPSLGGGGRGPPATLLMGRVTA